MGRWMSDSILNNYNEQEHGSVARRLRRSFLSKFDIYKTNYLMGIITPTAEEHQEVLDWYQDLLDLKMEAFENIPVLMGAYIK